jgi:two-component system, NtrC family, sensor histidine kinase HydH
MPMTGPSPPRVLVVDDDADTLANLRDILELDDWRVETAATAAEALAHGDWSGYTAVLLDRHLPDGTADDLLPRVRELAPDAALVIITGYADVDGAVSALRHGAADYIIKPISPEVLRVRLGRIAESRRAKLRLAQAEERLLQAERLAAIGQMVTGLAHESGNALQRSQACLQILANRLRDRPDLVDLVDRIQAAQNHLLHLYEDVRGYAAPIRLQTEVCELAAIWRQAWDDLGVLRGDRRTELREHVRFPDTDIAGDGLGVKVRIDPFRFKQVFRIILENALAASPDPVLIDIDASPAVGGGRKGLRLAVRDNGPGVPPEERSRVFEPFVTTKTKGTGLGLAIARRIVEAHDGRIGLGDRGPGCEVVITLPWEAP